MWREKATDFTKGKFLPGLEANLLTNRAAHTTDEVRVIDDNHLFRVINQCDLNGTMHLLELD